MNLNDIDSFSEGPSLFGHMRVIRLVKMRRDDDHAIRFKPKPMCFTLIASPWLNWTQEVISQASPNMVGCDESQILI